MRKRLLNTIEVNTPTVHKAETLLQEYERQRLIALKTENERLEINNIDATFQAEKASLTTAIKLLEDYYTKTKQQTVEKLEKEITDVVNLWYSNNYEFEIETHMIAGKMYASLKDKKRGGKLSIVCGGAVKQTLGVLFNFAFIRSVNSDFIFLDESFSSLGLEEINRLPEVFDTVSDMQLICIEHKVELIDSSNAATIEVTRNENESSKINLIDPNNLTAECFTQMDNKEQTPEDDDILRNFGFDPDQVRQSRQSQPKEVT